MRRPEDVMLDGLADVDGEDGVDWSGLLPLILWLLCGYLMAAAAILVLLYIWIVVL